MCVLECSWAPALPLELSQPEGELRRQVPMPAVEVLCGAARPAVSPRARLAKASHLASVLVLLASCSHHRYFKYTRAQITNARQLGCPWHKVFLRNASVENKSLKEKACFVYCFRQDSTIAFDLFFTGGNQDSRKYKILRDDILVPQ